MKKEKNSLIINIFIFMLISIISLICTKQYTESTIKTVLLKQIIWYIVGFILIYIITKIKNNIIIKNSFILYIIGNLILLLLLIFGKPINNSKCWIIIPKIGNIQPSEFMKIILILLLANLISKYKPKNQFKLIISSLLILLIPSILTFLEPDTGSVIIYIIIYTFIIILSNINYKWFISAICIATILVSVNINIYINNETLFRNMYGTKIYYRIERLLVWKNQNNFQLKNSLASIGTASYKGHGINKIPLYIPEETTDFIFASYASCFGYIGTIIIILILLNFDLILIKIMFKTKKIYNKAIISGTLGMLLYQQIQNIGMCVGLLPITGITLPFISYGGSSLLSYMIAIGLIINICKEKDFT